MSLVIIGAGGFGREVLQYSRDAGLEVKGFVDDQAVDGGVTGLPVLGTIGGYEPAPGDEFLLAIGRPELRLAIGQQLRDRGARFTTLVHPLAYVASSAEIGEGSIIAPFATIGAHAVLGRDVVLTFYASVAHDCVVGNASALSPYSVCNGGGRLGEAAFLGAAAVVNPLRSVGAHARVAAGSVVYRDVPERTLASGNPAKARPLL